MLKLDLIDESSSSYNGYDDYSSSFSQMKHKT